MDCYEILGIEKNCSLVQLKNAYREKVKQFHPDIIESDDKYNAHIRMIEINEAYTSIKKNILETYSNSNIEIEKNDENDYAIYRKGIKLFQSIHPSKWKKMTLEALFKPNFIQSNSEETTKIIRKLINNLSESYYYFSIIVNEYPKSNWSIDSKEKMIEIEKMTTRYKRILESYIKEKTI